MQLYHILDIPSLKKLGVTANDTVIYPRPFHLKSCIKALPLKIDWEESTRAARLCVRPHVDEDLDELKRIYNGIDSVLVSLRIFTVCFVLTSSIVQSR